MKPRVFVVAADAAARHQLAEAVAGSGAEPIALSSAAEVGGLLAHDGTNGALPAVAVVSDDEATVRQVELELERRRLEREVASLRRRVDAAHGFDEIIGESQPMQQVFDLLGRAAESNATVLITGESGTGKELVARALHRRGRRASGPFIALNCAAVPETLLESELFGHTRGAFTDARTEKKGLLVRASGGTLLLDEVGEMALSMQVKLLRALQERAVTPVGGQTEVPFDVRLISATNRNLEADVEAGAFRQDLYYRLNVIHIDVPPLRVRGTDRLVLAEHFLSRLADEAEKEIDGFSAEATERLLDYDWPGNVRELFNCVERAVALTRDREIAVSDLPDKVRRHQSSALVIPAATPEDLLPLEEVERRYVRRVLAAAHGNRTLAARILQIDRKTLRRKLAAWGEG